MRRRIRPALAAALLTAVAATATIGQGAGTDPKQALTCVSPLDATGIDAVLAAGGSPLAGEGATFVDAAASWGLDPRALVAIAAHETILETYGPAIAIRNPFGIGPGRRFETNGAAIAFAARLLARHYVGEGRRTLSEISGKWAPIGAANDPGNLNANWTAGVGASYRRLGGNPDAPITLESQSGVACAAVTSAPTVGVGGTPAAGTVAWNGAPPAVEGPLMERGADPSTGLAATIAGFVFPLVPSGTPIVYRDDFAEPGGTSCYGRSARCVVTLTAGPGTVVAAAASGVLAAATPQEQSGGIAFWIVTGAEERIGYSGLAAYAPGIADRVVVTAGQALGSATRETRVAWERSAHRINPFPLLRATFPSQG